MIRLSIIAAMLALAGCGVDGEPEPYPRDGGVTVSGTASIGVVSD